MNTPRRSSLAGSTITHPRRSPRLLELHSTRSETGRLLQCSPKAANAYRPPFKDGSAFPDQSVLGVVPMKRSAAKRISDQALTPLRREISGVDTDFLRPPKSLSPPICKDSFEAMAALLSSEVVPTDTELKAVSTNFDFCGLPEDVRLKYTHRRNIKDLYAWQKECLSDHRIRRGSNCIVSLPTGAGKTLVAEILMLREAIVNKRSSILVLPYVAIVQEKITSLSVFEEEFGIRIEEYAATKGRLPPIKRRRGSSIYVATIEKANMLMNSLIETGGLDSIGLVVVDELHMVGEGSRGAVIEELITKYLYKGSGQIVGMSATLSNMDDLAKFLRAYVFSTDFRPVELQEFVRIKQQMWRVMPDGKLQFEADLKMNKMEKIDPDGVCQLLENVIPDHSVIIFCPTKKNCENMAALIAKTAPSVVRLKRKDERVRLVASIKEDNDGKLDAQLEFCLLSGIAFHHSGITHDERKHIEAAYTDGVLCVVCATSTLAAGVNLPARRVIIKSPMVGINALGKAQYLQMAGRAGRAGFDPKGTCITIVRPGLEHRQFTEMLCGPMLSCISALTDHHLSSFVLDLISLKLAMSVDEVMEIMACSLVLAQKGFAAVREEVLHVVKRLVEEELLQEINDVLSATTLGSATFDANFDPTEARRLGNDLENSLNKGLVFSSHFHLLFTISPYDTACNVNWDLFHDEYKSLSEGEKLLLKNSGLPEGVIIHSLITKKRLEPGSPSMRLYIALMLQKVWNQEAHWIVAEKFGVERGWMQSVLQGAVAQAAAIARFSEKLPHLWPLRLLLPELVQRLSDCVRVELIPLMAIDGVKRGRARQLYEAGFKTVGAIAKADAAKLVTAVEHLKKFQAVKIINSAKSLLRDQLDEKMEEIEAMGLDINDISL